MNKNECNIETYKIKTVSCDTLRASRRKIIYTIR